MERKTALSPRQTEIMRLAAEGLTDKEIAQRTGLSVGTLRSHWDRMRARLDARSRGEVIARAAEDVRRSLIAEIEVLRLGLCQGRTFVCTATADGVVDYVNAWFTEYSGLPRESLIGVGCRVLMPEEQADESRERWWDAQRLAVGYRAQVLFRSASGAFLPHIIELMPLQTIDGRVVRWLGTATACSPSA